jgi:hypothetical protein
LFGKLACSTCVIWVSDTDLKSVKIKNFFFIIFKYLAELSDTCRAKSYEYRTPIYVGYHNTLNHKDVYISYIWEIEGVLLLLWTRKLCFVLHVLWTWSMMIMSKWTKNFRKSVLFEPCGLLKGVGERQVLISMLISTLRGYPAVTVKCCNI